MREDHLVPRLPAVFEEESGHWAGKGVGAGRTLTCAAEVHGKMLPQRTPVPSQEAMKTTLQKENQNCLDLEKLECPLLLPRQPLEPEAGACGKAGLRVAMSYQVPKVPC